MERFIVERSAAAPDFAGAVTRLERYDARLQRELKALSTLSLSAVCC